VKGTGRNRSFLERLVLLLQGKRTRKNCMKNKCLKNSGSNGGALMPGSLTTSQILQKIPAQKVMRRVHGDFKTEYLQSNISCFLFVFHPLCSLLLTTLLDYSFVLFVKLSAGIANARVASPTCKSLREDLNRRRGREIKK
jgi:hypothetical protein